MIYIIRCDKVGAAKSRARSAGSVLGLKTSGCEVSERRRVQGDRVNGTLRGNYMTRPRNGMM